MQLGLPLSLPPRRTLPAVVDAGTWLASSGDGGEVFLWKPTESGVTRINQLEDTIQAPWQRATTLRCVQ